MFKKLLVGAATSAMALAVTLPAFAQDSPPGASADTKGTKTTSSPEPGGTSEGRAPKGATSADTKGTMTTGAKKSGGAMMSKGSKSKASMGKAKKKKM